MFFTATTEGVNSQLKSARMPEGIDPRTDDETDAETEAGAAAEGGLPMIVKELKGRWQ